MMFLLLAAAALAIAVFLSYNASESFEANDPSLRPMVISRERS